MRSAPLLLLLLLLPGCDALRSFKNDNPVMGPPPPRFSMAEPPARPADAAAPGDIMQVAGSTTGRARASDDLLFGSRIVATVNGAPIFMSDILETYGDEIEKARGQIAPEQYEKLVEKLVRQDLPQHIERVLLVEALKGTLKPEQLEMIQAEIDRMFDAEHVPRLKEQFKVGTKHELDIKLQEAGTSLISLRDAFGNQLMAREYVNGKVERPKLPTRQDLLQYYREHLHEYAQPTRVKWQQIQISGQGNRSAAETRLRQVQAELDAGADFAEVARKFSDGPRASEGGQWDWTQPGSLANKQVQELLLKLPVGEASDAVPGPDGFQIVRVTERRDAGHTPFEELQDQIREKMQKDAEADPSEKVLEDLYATAVIETPYELPPRGEASSAAGNRKRPGGVRR